MTERGVEAVSDTGAIDAFVETVLAANEEVVEQVRAGDDKPLNFLMGQVMKASGGKADPGQVRRILAEKIRGG